MVNEAQAVFGCGEWSANEKDLLGIVVLEGLAVLFTLLCVGPMVGGAQVVLQSDNAGVVFMLLKEHSRDPRLCALLQAIVAVQQLYGYRVLVGHTSTLFMGETDDLSRGVPAERCLSPRPGGWSESQMWRWAQQASCAGLGSSLHVRSLERGAAVQQWVSSIVSLTGSIVGSRGLPTGMCIPFVPYRHWAVTINDPAHRRSTLLS